LQRNALAVAASALFLANLSGSDAPRLLAVVAGAARVRIARDLSVGIERLVGAPPGQLNAAYADALNVLDQSERREVADFDSLAPYAGESLKSLLERLTSDLKLTQLNHKKRLEEWYQALGGKEYVPTVSPREKALAAQVPKNLGTLGEYLRRRREIEGPKGLHPLMRYEALNYVDGRRTILDIYHAVRAESLSAGEWYYGTVTLDLVEDLFKLAEKQQVLEIAGKPM
jgi:hypothetical protein